MINIRKNLNDYPDIMNRKQVAEYLGVGLNTIKDLLETPVDRGGIPNICFNQSSKKPQRHIYKPKFQEWLNNNIQYK